MLKKACTILLNEGAMSLCTKAAKRLVASLPTPGQALADLDGIQPYLRNKCGPEIGGPSPIFIRWLSPADLRMRLNVSSL